MSKRVEFLRYDTQLTNADRIREMSDEELRKFLCHNTECGSCRWCQPQGCTLDEWLQQPAEAE